MSELVFAYGSNMNLNDLRQWMEKRCVQPEKASEHISILQERGRRACLPGFRLVWNYYSATRGGGAANVERDRDSRVYGVVYEVEPDLLELFDKKEGHPRSYCREKAEIELLDSGERLNAYVYVAHPLGDELFPPTKEYLAIVTEGARSWGLPNEWIEHLQRTGKPD